MTPVPFLVSESNLLFRFGDRIDVALSRQIADLATTIPTKGIVDLVPSYTTLLMTFDPESINAQTLVSTVRRIWNDQPDQIEQAPRNIDIPTVYGGRHGPDLPAVANHAKLSPEDVIERHTRASYTVGAIGFSPGFGYLIGLPEALTTPRLAIPRIRVPAGSVAIGGAQTAIYPVETSGGWNLIGRTATRLFDSISDSPFLLRNGDTVRFRRVDSFDQENILRINRKPVPVGGIEVLTPGLLTTVQDAGRSGFGAFGLSPNGAADLKALSLGNELVGNAVGMAGLEITLSGPCLRFRQGATIAITGSGPDPRRNGHSLPRNRAIHAFLGDVVEFDPIESTSGSRSYLSVAGGIEVPDVMGSRSTDLVAGIGGFDGRALQSGDVIVIGSHRRIPRFHAALVRQRRRTRIRVHPGPQRDMFEDATWQRFIQRPYTVTNDANRVGIRLNGPAIHPRSSSDIISEGVATGSIQIPGSGQPIVLLPGRATIGGYPKIATVIDSDLDLLGQLRPGDTIRFIAFN